MDTLARVAAVSSELMTQAQSYPIRCATVNELIRVVEVQRMRLA
ncbi:hypothetical protein WAE56_18245 [Iodobacter sp. LRB]